MLPATDLTTAELGGWVSALTRLEPSQDDAERIDRIRLLEEIKGACAAAQAAETVEFRSSQREQQEAAGVPTEEVGRGIRHQVALARRESPHRGGRLVGLAEALVGEMPHTYASLAAGRINEWRATLLVQATACLSREDRAAVDAELADRLDTLGDRALAQVARSAADRLDPQAAVQRASKAAAERRVTIRPVPDTMVSLTGLLPAADGVAAYTALAVAADLARARGDSRGRGQIMADLLLARLTGRDTAQAQPQTWSQRVAATTWSACDSEGATEDPEESRGQGARDVGLELQLVMTDQTLFGVGPDADEPAHLAGYGAVPAPVIRELIAAALERAGEGGDHSVWVRRLYTHPATGALVAMESTRREVPTGLGRFLRTRDRWCRTPWCGAPLRHLDHVVPVAEGGATSETNAQGLCEACNYAKEALGWRARPGPGGAGESVRITTPTGRTYFSAPPLPPGTPLSVSGRGRVRPLTALNPPRRHVVILPR